MNHKISLLLPTRGRPLLVKRLFQSIIDYTTDLDNLEIIMYLDEDDHESHGIEDSRLHIIKKIGPRSTMGTYNTKCFEGSSGDIIMLMNDDLVILTPGWDRIIVDHFKSISDGIYLAYPNDSEAGHRMCTFPIMPRKTCEILLKPYPKEYEALFIDVHIFDVFLRLKHLGYDRMFYLKDVVFDHRHFISGKVRADANYLNKDRYKDGVTFTSLRHLRQISAKRLLGAIQGKPLPGFPDSIAMEKPPKNLAHAVIHYFSVFLTDYGLPLTWRLLWFVRYTKYFAAMKSGFGFLKRKSYTLYGCGINNRV